MPTHSTLPPAEATAKAVDALLCAIEGAPSSGAVAAYRAAITRHGRNLIATAGPDALDVVRERVAALAPSHADERAETMACAWAGLGAESPAADMPPSAPESRGAASQDCRKPGEPVSRDT